MRPDSFALEEGGPNSNSDRPVRVTKGSLDSFQESREHTLNEGKGQEEIKGSRREVLDTPMPVLEKQNSLELRSLLGKGGMGNVYLAKDTTLMRQVAYKCMHPEKGLEPELVQRFLREAQINAQLDHPGVVPVYALVSGEGNIPAYTMKVVEGSTLDDLLTTIKQWYEDGGAESGSLPEEFSLSTQLEYFLKVCDTVSYAHSKGVLHRDLKPDNMMLGHFGEVYVVDWGVACLMSHKEEARSTSGLVLEENNVFHTEAGHLVGTPRYMSPEQARAELDTLDERSDLYALGLILFELVSLQNALPSGKRSVILEHALKGKLKELRHRSSNISIPPDLRAIVQKATALLPEERYESVAAMADDLRRYLRDEAISITREPPVRALLRTMRKHQERVVLAIVMLVFLLIGLNGWWLYHQKEVEVRTQHKEQKLAHQLLVVARLSHQVDQRFFQWESLLERLAHTAQMALLHGTPSATPYFLHRNFHPPDLQWSELYRDKLSTSWPVIKLTPKTKEASVRPLLQRLALLQRSLRDVVFDSKRVELSLPSRRLLIKGHLPLLSSFVATREGVMMLFPGRGSYPKHYDPRQRPWFRAVAGKRGIHWSKPYVSSQKIRAVLMACTTSIFDSKGTFLAVAGIDLRVNKMASTLRRVMFGKPWMKESYLLQENGKIVAQTGRIYQRVMGRQIINQPRDMNTFSSSILRQYMKQKYKEGYFFMKTTKGPKLVVFVRLQSQPWYYVVVGK